jgi:hypothetical protein
LSARSFKSFWLVGRFQKSGSPLSASISSTRFFSLARSKMPPEVLCPAGEIL